ncbi:MAG TPA: hypothetical protein VHO94_04240 [Oscillospiraceae bacterium]|nr:hypothetical protein [Oscillospiraceae bacterium]
MSEKFYIVTDKSKLHKEYFEYRENFKAVTEVAQEFFKEHGIDPNTSYCPCTCALYLIPSKEDKEKFASQLSKNCDNQGLYKVKETSKLGRAWVDTLSKNHLSVLRKPLPQFYFRTLTGRGDYRLFDIDGTLYCSYQNDNDFPNPDGFTEIKASEFFKIIEDYEAKQEDK